MAELRVLNNEEILVSYYNWCEEQLLPDLPTDRTKYTLANISTLADARDLKLIELVRQADLKAFVEWLEDECLVHDMDSRDTMRLRRECDECRKSLKQLVET